MRIIAHSTANNTSYIINPQTYHIGWSGSPEVCEAHLRYMTFHDFWFNTKDSHGRSMTPNPTIHYKTVFRPDYIDPTPYDGVASGWWEMAPYTALDMQYPADYERFNLCAQAS